MQLEERQQLAAATVGVEQPRRAAAHAGTLAQEFRPRVVGFHLVDQEAATGQVGPGQPVALLGTRQRHQQGVAAFVQQCLVGHRAGGDDAHHLALDQALGQRRIADLLADRHRLTQRHQP
ncbi:hypothetical protein G6F63_015728 [Rhizopus arrhizus]|nr:hypothetical protein G6F63_015728 [Rhizopus arrhizus]